MSITVKLREALIPAIEGLGYNLWGIEFISNGRSNLLRIYIDSAAGISIDDCEKASRQIAAILDVEDFIVSKYILEVSSPGLDRPLFEPSQFVENIGKQVKIKLSRAFDGRRNFQGVLQNVVDGELFLMVDNTEYILPLELVDRANVVPSF